MKLSSLLPFCLLASSLPPGTRAFCPAADAFSRSSSIAAAREEREFDAAVVGRDSRRSFLSFLPSALIGTAAVTVSPSTAAAYAPTGAGSGNLPDLPPEAVRSYLQYRIPLTIAADFYVFDLQAKLADTDSWGEVNQLFENYNNKGQGNPSRIERDFVNPMRILLLSLPPDYSDDMRIAQYKFERAMQTISKSVGGYKKDLPVEIDSSMIGKAQGAWEDGREALNEFFVLLNEATGLKDEMRTIPPAGPNQREQYGRSSRRYFDLVKKTKLCQNRGGPALSQAWGQLMVSGYLQDSCGIPDLDEYFYQNA